MKILLVNKFYYPRGGDCIYTIELEKLLLKHGNDVAIYTMQYPHNLPHKDAAYWPSEVDFSKKSPANLLKAICRPLYSREVKTSFSQLLKDFKPDLVHLNNIHSQLSPMLAKLAWKKKVPVVWTLHDYKLVCPAYTCLREGVSCELCYKDKKQVLKQRCLKGSLLASALAWLEALLWSVKKTQKYTNSFICPSQFLKDQMIKGGIISDKLKVVSNFVPESKVLKTEIAPRKSDYFVYLGRLSKEKGIETLLKAITKSQKAKLKVIGGGPLEQELKKNFASSRIEFTGPLSWDAIAPLLTAAIAMILPSEWYENNPLSIMEAFAQGTPVIGSNIGGIPELVEDGVTGYLFESGNVEDLQAKIAMLLENPKLATEMGSNARKKVEQAYNAELHYERLMEVYKKIIPVS